MKIGCHLSRFDVAGKRQWAAALVAVLLVVAGCATVPAGVGVSKDSPAEVKAAAVKERAQARWDAMVKGDFAAAYRYLSPASKEVTTPEQFEKRHNRAIRGARVEQASCAGEACEVQIAIIFDHKVAKGLETLVRESWIIADGQAWLVYRQ